MLWCLSVSYTPSYLITFFLDHDHIHILTIYPITHRTNLWCRVNTTQNLMQICDLHLGLEFDWIERNNNTSEIKSLFFFYLLLFSPIIFFHWERCNEPLSKSSHKASMEPGKGVRQRLTTHWREIEREMELLIEENAECKSSLFLSSSLSAHRRPSETPLGRVRKHSGVRIPVAYASRLSCSSCHTRQQQTTQNPSLSIHRKGQDRIYHRARQ